jgi:hypothetical protein
VLRASVYGVLAGKIYSIAEQNRQSTVDTFEVCF